MNRIFPTLLLVAGLVIKSGSVMAAENPTAVPSKLVIHADQGKDAISKNLYGQFSSVVMIELK